MRVTNGIPLGCSLLLPGDTVNCVQTLKGVLATLYASLANLYAKAKRPNDALRAYGDSIAVLPRAQLADAASFPRDRMERFVQSASKAAWVTGVGTHAATAEAALSSSAASGDDDDDDGGGGGGGMDEDEMGSTHVGAAAAAVSDADPPAVSFTVASFVREGVIPPLSEHAIAALLKLQLQCCRESTSPEHTIGQQLQIIAEMVAVADDVQEGAWLYGARI
jgi:hypothetical protein